MIFSLWPRHIANQKEFRKDHDSYISVFVYTVAVLSDVLAVEGTFTDRICRSEVTEDFAYRFIADSIFLIAACLFYLLTKIRLSYLRAQHRFSHLQLSLLKISIRRLDELLYDAGYYMEEEQPTNSKYEAILCSAIYM